MVAGTNTCLARGGGTSDTPREWAGALMTTLGCLLGSCTWTLSDRQRGREGARGSARATGCAGGGQMPRPGTSLQHACSRWVLALRQLGPMGMREVHLHSVPGM